MSWKIKFNGAFFIILVFIFLIAFISFVFYKTEISTSNVFRAQNGVMQIPYETFKDNIVLNGEWKFYDEQFVDASVMTENSTVVEFPHVNSISEYGTYAIEIQGLRKGGIYGLYVPDNASAYTLYLNDELLAKGGQIAKDRENEIKFLGSRTIVFSAPSQTITLYYQLSAFHTFPSGFIKPILLGNSENIIKAINRNILAQMMLFGAIAILALYNFSLFLLNPKELSALFFSLFNLAVATRILFTGERVINTFVKDLNWGIGFNILFISGTMMLFFFSFFICYMFRELNHKIFLRIISTFSVFMIVALFVFDKNILSVLDSVFFVVTISSFIYIIFVQIKLMKKNVVGSNFAFIGSVFMIGTIILDSILPAGTNIVPTGISIFVIFYSLVISEKYTFIYEQNILLNQAAIRDSMTNLYKKGYFRNLIEKIISKSEAEASHALMFIDIDDFKSINDNYGHDVGDEVIIRTAHRIIQSLNYSDIACRFGGDEFIVWLHDVKKGDAERVANRILKNIMKPIKVENFEILISVSIGISLYGSEVNSFEDLVIESDRRMYLAKAEGKNRYRITG